MANWTGGRQTAVAAGIEISVEQGGAVLLESGRGLTATEARELALALNEAADIVDGKPLAASGERLARLPIGKVLTGDNEEPPVGTVLMDREGDQWKHFADGWRVRNLGQERWYGHAKHNTWMRVATTYGPLVTTPDPDPADWAKR